MTMWVSTFGKIANTVCRGQAAYLTETGKLS